MMEAHQNNAEMIAAGKFYAFTKNVFCNQYFTVCSLFSISNLHVTIFNLVSAPLLESIQHLEEKVSARDKEYEQIVSEREITINALNSEKGTYL